MIEWLMVLIVFYIDGGVHILLDRGSCFIEWFRLDFYCSIELELDRDYEGFHMVRGERELFERHNDMLVTWVGVTESEVYLWEWWFVLYRDNWWDSYLLFCFLDLF